MDGTLLYLVLDDAERALSDQLIAAWSKLAHAGALDWPERATGEMTLDTALHAASDPGTPERCKFWWPIVHDRR